MGKIIIMVVDDEKILLTNIADYLEDYDIKTFSDPRPALEELKVKAYDILIVDYKMPGMSGLELLRAAKEMNAYTYGILFTAYADKELLQHAINEGIVSRLIEKPLRLKEFREAVDDAQTVCRSSHEQEQKLRHFDELVKEMSRADEKIIGLDKGLKSVFLQAQSAALYPAANVLLTGETGTGKDVIARLIHKLSDRRNECFIPVDCTAIPDGLLESMLFGTVRGAFSGAVEMAGKIELADRGTLFLDEIGDMKPELQVKLLRVLQDKKVERLGSNRTREIDFRLITATNQDLEKKVAEKTFREDLYYRINVFQIHIPALRERKNDIEELVLFYLVKYCRDMNINPYSLDKEVLAALKQYSWPGNIRELINTLRRVLMNDRLKVLTGAEPREQLTTADFGILFNKGGNEPPGLMAHINALSDLVIARLLDVDDITGKVLKAVLRNFGNNITRASKETGINRGRFYRIPGGDAASSDEVGSRVDTDKADPEVKDSREKGSGKNG